MYSTTKVIQIKIEVQVKH